MRRAEHILEEFLVASARMGDEPAFRRLVEFRSPKLLAHATRLLGDVELARDAVQDAWIEIVNGLHSLRDDRAFATWAYKITSRCCARMVKKAVRDREIERAIEHNEDAVPSAADGFEIERDAVRKAIWGLPREQRAAIALFYLEDMSVGEVASALDVPIGTVKTRLMHARTKLRTALKGHDDG